MQGVAAVTSDNLVLIVAGVVGLLLIWLAFKLIVRAITVALLLFAWAAEQGFVGVAAYVACWVFLFPVMLAICIIGAVFLWIVDRQNAYSEKRKTLITAHDSPNMPHDEAEQQLWEEQDRRYEEAKVRLAAEQKEPDDEL